jgi:hypothetical protein
MVEGLGFLLLVVVGMVDSGNSEGGDCGRGSPVRSCSCSGLPY